jgi:hypothetical protein
MAGSKFLLTMKLTARGDVRGSSTEKEGVLDYSKGMECHWFEYEVLTQIDPQSGRRRAARICLGVECPKLGRPYPAAGAFLIQLSIPEQQHVET